MKLLLVWYLDLGIMGLALGTSFGAWINLAVLSFFARKRGVLVATPELTRAIAPVAVIVALVAAAIFGGLELGTLLLEGFFLAEEGIFLCAFLGAGVAFGVSVYLLRDRLPLKDALRT
jgi:putative peptidoglycan lipid II flippase